MRYLALACSLLLLACAADDIPPEIDGLTQEVAEACPAHISASLTVPWGWYYGSTDTWNLSTGWNLSDPWCPYWNADGLLYLFHAIPSGGDCAQFGATSWWCWGAGGSGAYAVQCPGGQRVRKPDAYKPTSVAAWKTPWRADWTTYESQLPALNAHTSLRESINGAPYRLRCDYSASSLWLWLSR